MIEKFLDSLYTKVCDHTDIRMVKLAQLLNTVAFINSKEEAVVLFFTENVSHDHPRLEIAKLVSKRLAAIEPSCIMREIIEVSPKDYDRHQVFAREIKRSLENSTPVSSQVSDIVYNLYLKSRRRYG